MRRFEVTERGQPALPAIDLADEVVVIGSGAGARVRLPAQVARDAHVRFTGTSWVAVAEVVVDGTPRVAGDTGAIGNGVVFELAGYASEPPGEQVPSGYSVRVGPAPLDAPASTPQRTESLARELLRGLLGAGAAPAFELERGPGAGARRELPPPETTLVVGRGDEAGWVILDEDLSREHVEIRRGWDGVTIRDLGSKNGTAIDGIPIRGIGVLRDGARVELGNIVLVFRDPAERHLRGEQPVAARAEPPAPAVSLHRSPLPFVIAAGIFALALVGLAWLLLS